MTSAGVIDACLSCGRSTAPGTRLFSDRSVTRDADGLGIHLCGYCNERAVSRFGRQPTAQQLIGLPDVRGSEALSIARRERIHRRLGCGDVSQLMVDVSDVISTHQVGGLEHDESSGKGQRRFQAVAAFCRVGRLCSLRVRVERALPE